MTSMQSPLSPRAATYNPLFGLFGIGMRLYLAIRPQVHTIERLDDLGHDIPSDCDSVRVRWPLWISLEIVVIQEHETGAIQHGACAHEPGPRRLDRIITVVGSSG